MKIEEAKKAIKASSKAMTDINAIHSFGHIPCKQAIPVNDVINIIDQIETDQPKPVVPQCVAEWYEEHKEDLEYDLYFYQMSIYDLKAKKDDFYHWMQKTNNPVHKLINMHQFGYTVEKEKLYRVKLNDHLYFKEFIDSMFPIFVIDDMPGALDDAFIGKEELALKHAREFGGILEEAKEVTK